MGTEVYSPKRPHKGHSMADHRELTEVLSIKSTSKESGQWKRSQDITFVPEQVQSKDNLCGIDISRPPPAVVLSASF